MKYAQKLSLRGEVDTFKLEKSHLSVTLGSNPSEEIPYEEIRSIYFRYNDLFCGIGLLVYTAKRFGGRKKFWIAPLYKQKAEGGKKKSPQAAKKRDEKFLTFAIALQQKTLYSERIPSFRVGSFGSVLTNVLISALLLSPIGYFLFQAFSDLQGYIEKTNYNFSASLLVFFLLGIIVFMFLLYPAFYNFPRKYNPKEFPKNLLDEIE